MLVSYGLTVVGKNSAWCRAIDVRGCIERDDVTGSLGYPLLCCDAFKIAPSGELARAETAVREIPAAPKPSITGDSRSHCTTRDHEPQCWLSTCTPRNERWPVTDGCLLRSLIVDIDSLRVLNLEVWLSPSQYRDCEQIQPDFSFHMKDVFVNSSSQIAMGNDGDFLVLTNAGCNDFIKRRFCSSDNLGKWLGPGNEFC